MVNRSDIYKCEVCGNIVAALHGGAGKLVCCEQPMKLYQENTVDASLEKHVPVVVPAAGGIKVTVGSVPHPMLETHWIEWIEVLAGGKSYREFLKPGGEPAAFFPVQDEDITVREFCNLHGLWKA